MKCEHLDFAAQVNVHRLSKDEGGPIAVATIFRDPMNFAVLIGWRA